MLRESTLTGVRFVTGAMGAGKTLFCVSRLVERLQMGRTVVTNIAMNQDGVASYLESGPYVDLPRRLRVLGPEDDLAEFWRYRGWDDSHGWVLLGQWDKTTGQTRFDGNPGPVDYFLDEVHLVYPARKWGQTSLGVTWYTRQHRKFGDSVWLITHDEGDVDKLLRVGCAEHIRVTNNRTRRLFTFFRGGSGFTAKAYAQPPGRSSVPMATGHFSLDVTGLCGCYDTSAGVGVVGGMNADKAAKVRGIPIWTFPLLIVGGLWLGWEGLAWFGSGFVRATGITKSASGVAGATNTVPRSRSIASALLPGRLASTGLVEGPEARPFTAPSLPEVTLTACAWVGPGRWVVGLSDGRQYDPGDPRVISVYKDSVIIRETNNEHKQYHWAVPTVIGGAPLHNSWSAVR